ncbi:Josephin-domain-containing protein [Polychytrium aggregatum]|uniref:Josephin-domain-containing protein n=1 Tax=Polychytrium aggregatum TaxID=110093 RepID=UPI0022FE9DD0|nr:Josephin-domain-containing protein [Polychytrium aggregatum]KAI9204415.1 Josephin-domain-containing protein [Polychytrium aggregatum]
MDLAQYIFHEKQEGALCAQHALNSLLQEPIFNAVDLAEVAVKVDELEHNAVRHSGGNHQDIARYLHQRSSNYDDTGYFSIQVIMKALEPWSLTLVSVAATREQETLRHPEHERAFILNLDSHWMALRKFGIQRPRWFNLDSTLHAPQPISDTYLAMLLMEYRDRGYSVFVVRGVMPDCQADKIADEGPGFQERRWTEQEEFELALAMSLDEQQQHEERLRREQPQRHNVYEYDDFHQPDEQAFRPFNDDQQHANARSRRYFPEPEPPRDLVAGHGLDCFGPEWRPVSDDDPPLSNEPSVRERLSPPAIHRQPGTSYGGHDSYYDADDYDDDFDDDHDVYVGNERKAYDTRLPSQEQHRPPPLDPSHGEPQRQHPAAVNAGREPLPDPSRQPPREEPALERQPLEYPSDRQAPSVQTGDGSAELTVEELRQRRLQRLARDNHSQQK